MTITAMTTDSRDPRGALLLFEERPDDELATLDG